MTQRDSPKPEDKAPSHLQRLYWRASTSLAICLLSVATPSSGRPRSFLFSSTIRLLFAIVTVTVLELVLTRTLLYIVPKEIRDDKLENMLFNLITGTTTMLLVVTVVRTAREMFSTVMNLLMSDEVAGDLRTNENALYDAVGKRLDNLLGRGQRANS